MASKQLLHLIKAAMPTALRVRIIPLAQPRSLILTSKRAIHTHNNTSSLTFESNLTSVPFKKTFNKILIANRGEIACRIIKTAKKMGIKTVAVYSDLDATALHVQMADEAINLGSASSSETYLSIPRILSAVEQSGAEAVHPGYGFLSENPAFVEALEQKNVTFIGPKASAISAMGDKIQSKLIAQASGVHCIPGFHGEVKTVQEALSIANEIGYPVMVKASAGGGGKGMRIAWNDKELSDGFKLAKQESKSSFGDDRMLIERYIDNPRHIEIQVLGDNFGNVIYLPERECSIQRRNQKVIEESPSVHMDQETRRRMGEQAVALARHVGYNSAGTVEFLVDASRQFYFLEMNTRLQVEHPITEYVTGLDLVEQMLYSAANHRLSLKQEDISLLGWAFESRVYAEDPEKYLPSVGRLLTYQEPVVASRGGKIRCDSGFIEGSEMHVEYDPLISKLATHGRTRKEALQLMIQALDEYIIKGVTHNIPLLRAVFAHPRFQEGRQVTTHFLTEEYPHGFQTEALDQKALKQLALVAGGMWIKKEFSHWQGKQKLMKEFQNLQIQITDEHNQHMLETKIKLKPTEGSNFEAVTATGLLKFSTEWSLNGLLTHTHFEEKKKLIVQYLDPISLGFRIQYHGNKYKVKVLTEEQYTLSKYMKTKSIEEHSKMISSPMPGKIVSLAVKEGDEVIEGSELVVVEAMKMQNILRSPHGGTVKRVYVEPGNSVKSGQVLIEF